MSHAESQQHRPFQVSGVTQVLLLDRDLDCWILSSFVPIWKRRAALRFSAGTLLALAARRSRCGGEVYQGCMSQVSLVQVDSSHEMQTPMVCDE